MIYVKPKTETLSSFCFEKIKMKKFLLPFQNMVRADLFSGSLAVWNALGFAFHNLLDARRLVN